jgi:hypothetical protein
LLSDRLPSSSGLHPVSYAPGVPTSAKPLPPLRCTCSPDPASGVQPGPPSSPKKAATNGRKRLDATGTPLSNNVPVTLTVASGPGELPTGPSITFAPPGGGSASDIAVLDGQAAIEFRTDYSGTSTITASSPGLTSASVTITSQGSPAYLPGQTPPADTRPYQP